MKHFIYLAAFFPIIAFAAPSGHRSCRNKAHTVELVYGTYANAGTGSTLKLKETSYDVDVEAGEGFGAIRTLLIPFCNCEPVIGDNVGLFQWEATNGDLNVAETIKVSIDLPELKIKNLVLKCRELDYIQGFEQN